MGEVQSQTIKINVKINIVVMRNIIDFINESYNKLNVKRIKMDLTLHGGQL